MYVICRDTHPENCTDSKIESLDHVRDMNEVYSKEYANLYTRGQNVSLFCNFTGDPTPKATVGIDERFFRPFEKLIKTWGLGLKNWD